MAGTALVGWAATRRVCCLVAGPPGREGSPQLEPPNAVATNDAFVSYMLVIC